MGLIEYVMLFILSIMTENDIKNGQMNLRIVKSQEEKGKIHSYQDTWLPALNIFLYEILR